MELVRVLTDTGKDRIKYYFKQSKLERVDVWDLFLTRFAIIMHINPCRIT